MVENLCQLLLWSFLRGESIGTRSVRGENGREQEHYTANQYKYEVQVLVRTCLVENLYLGPREFLPVQIAEQKGLGLAARISMRLS
jgi:hypothetical protein